MKNYKIFMDSGGTLEAVKQGWSWPAFFFGGFWAVDKSLWKYALTGLLLLFTLNTVRFQITSSEQAQTLVSLITRLTIDLAMMLLFILFGWKGNLWREHRLRTLGYHCQSHIQARTPRSAVDLWLEHDETHDKNFIQTENNFLDLSLFKSSTKLQKG